MKGITVTFMMGPPGSGKSARAKSILNDDTIIISRDAIREMIKLPYSERREKIVYEIELTSIKIAIENNYSVIIDDTNMEKSTIDNIKKYIDKEVYFNYNPNYHIQKMFTPLDICIERDKASDRTHHVGEDIIRNYFKKYNINEETGEFKI